MFRTRISRLTGLCALTLFVSILQAAPVHIQVETGFGKEHGAGISVGKGSDCYIVTPAHVVTLAQIITVTDRSGATAIADPYQAPEGVDAALLKLRAGHSLECPEDWDDGSSGTQALHEATFLISRKVKQRGIQQRRFFLAGESSTTLTLQPFSANVADQLIEGDSGSALYANGSLVGMVVSVDTATGAGQALKQSLLHSLFSSTILEQDQQLVMVSPVRQGNRENRYATIAVRDFIDSETPFAVTELTPLMATAYQQSLRQGELPQYPDNVDIVIGQSIIAANSQRAENPTFKSGAGDTSNFGKQLLNSMTRRDVRYLYVTNVDVEVQILDPRSGQTYSHIEQHRHSAPLTSKANQQELANEAVTEASVAAVKAAMVKYDLLAENENDEPGGLLGLIFDGTN